MPKISNYQEQVTRALGGTSDRVAANTMFVNTGDSELFSLDSPGIYRIWIKNTGGTALNACKIQGRNSASAVWVDIITTASQFQDPVTNNVSGLLLMTDESVDPVTLASSGEWNGTIDSSMLAGVRMIATVASGSTSIQYEVS